MLYVLGDEMGKTYYLFSSGELKRQGNTLLIVNTSGKKYIPIKEVELINIFGEITINSKLLSFLSQKGILLNFYDYYGNYVGSFYPREHLLAGDILIKQVDHYLDTKKRMYIARQFVIGALKNIHQNLKYYKINIDAEEIIREIESSDSINRLMSIEGNFRKKYYSLLDEFVFREPFIIEKRTRQPPKNYMNALISFGNSLLYGITLKEIYHTQLNPSISYLHEPFYRRYSLALDIAEIFKPIIVDRIIFKLVNKQMLKEDHFVENMNGLLLDEKGKKIFIREFDEKMKSTIFHKKLKKHVSYQQLIRIEAYKLIKHLIGMEKYAPFVMWW